MVPCGKAQAEWQTSTVLAAKQILSASGQHIQLLHISLVKEYASSGELWRFLARKMHSMDPFRFPLTDPAELAAKPLDLMWEWCRPCEGRTAVAIAIDEAALLGSIQDIVEVMAELRAFRDARQLQSVVLVGTERVARLMEAVNSSASARNYSPFTWVSLSLSIKPKLRHLGCAKLALPACVSLSGTGLFWCSCTLPNAGLSIAGHVVLHMQ